MFGRTFWDFMEKIGPAMPIILIVLIIIAIYIICIFIIRGFDRRSNKSKNDKDIFRKPPNRIHIGSERASAQKPRKESDAVQTDNVSDFDNVSQDYIPPKPQNPIIPASNIKEATVISVQKNDEHNIKKPMPVPKKNISDMSAKEKTASEQYRRGTNAYNKENYPLAFEFFKRAAQHGNIDAQSSLAGMYENGLGVKQDFEESLKWYNMAAENGHVLAQYSLACKYQEGEGVNVDTQEAIRWYKKAAQQDFEPAKKALERIE
jgi:tetratricopeptide (TPR) repeat protein